MRTDTSAAPVDKDAVSRRTIMNTVTTSSLYHRLGGESAVDAAVELLYQKILDDHRIRHFFESMDMTRLRHLQRRFLGYAFNGPVNYNGRNMREAHRRLVEEMGLDDGHVDAVLENLDEALRELGVAEDLIQEAVLIADSVRDDVLNR